MENGKIIPDMIPTEAVESKSSTIFHFDNNICNYKNGHHNY